MKKSFFLLGGLGYLWIVPAMAQNGPTVPNMGPSVAAGGASLTSHLQLKDSQVERLDRLYQRYAPRRTKQEAALAQQQSELRQAQMPASFDERQSSRLTRDIADTRQKMAADFLLTRAEALKILTPVQRSQLQSLANDSRFRIREDNTYQLLASPLEAAWPIGYQSSASYRGGALESRSNRDKTNGHYGAYGGYGYGGPQYGVYGGVGQGPVSVYGGVGRGGPSIGIGIGRVFGLGRYLR